MQLRALPAEPRHSLHDIQGAAGKQIHIMVKFFLLTGGPFSGDDFLIGIHHVVNQPGRHRAGQIFQDLFVKTAFLQALFVIEHRPGKLPVLLLVGLHAAVVDGGLVRFLIPEVMDDIVPSKIPGPF